MKASIDSKGVLSIMGETDLEDYALTKWLESWPDKSILQIMTPIPGNPNNAVTPNRVEPKE